MILSNLESFLLEIICTRDDGCRVAVRITGNGDNMINRLSVTPLDDDAPVDHPVPVPLPDPVPEASLEVAPVVDSVPVAENGNAENPVVLDDSEDGGSDGSSTVFEVAVVQKPRNNIPDDDDSVESNNSGSTDEYDTVWGLSQESFLSHRRR